MKTNIYLYVIILTCLAQINAIDAVSQTVETATKKEKVDGLPVNKTFSFYYDDHNNVVLHGKTVVSAHINTYPDYDMFLFEYNETLNYSHGVMDGSYSYLFKKHKKYHHKYMDGWREKTTNKESYEYVSISGSYKNGERDGKWTLSNSEYLIIDGVKTPNAFSHNMSNVYRNGNIVETTDIDGSRIMTFETKVLPNGNEKIIVNGKYDKYNIRNGIVTNYYLQKDGRTDCPITDGDLKTLLSNINDPYQQIDELIEKGYGIKELTVSVIDIQTSYPSTYKPYATIYILFRPNIGDFNDAINGLEHSFGDRVEDFLLLHRICYDNSNAVYFKKAVYDSVKPYAEEGLREITKVKSQYDSLLNEVIKLKSTLFEKNSDGTFSKKYLDKNSKGTKEVALNAIESYMQYSFEDYLSKDKTKINQYPIKASIYKELGKYKDVLEQYVTFVYNDSSEYYYQEAMRLCSDKQSIWKNFSELADKEKLHVIEEYYNNSLAYKLYEDSKMFISETKATGIDALSKYCRHKKEYILSERNFISFVHYYDSLLMLDTSIRSLLRNSNRSEKDIAEYNQLFGSIDTNWTASDCGLRLRHDIMILDGYKFKLESEDAFANTLAVIDLNNEKISEILAKSKVIGKIYKNYYESIPRIQTELFDKDKKLIPYVECQVQLIEMLQNKDIKALDKIVKKEKITDMEGVFSILKENL